MMELQISYDLNLFEVSEDGPAGERAGESETETPKKAVAYCMGWTGLNWVSQTVEQLSVTATPCA